MSGKWDTETEQTAFVGGYDLYLPREVADALFDLRYDPDVVSVVVPDQDLHIPTPVGQAISDEADARGGKK